MSNADAQPPSRAHLAAAWAVHGLTASGAIAGTFALLRIGAGDLGGASLLMLLALVIDSMDGTLARAAQVSRLIPHFEGRRLDDMVDYLNFVIVPMVFMVEGELLPNSWWIVAPILASSYGFAQDDAKTEDDFFLGFPSYWNIVALYLWLLDLSPQAGALWVGGLSIAVFIPFKYLYPSKMKVLRTPTLIGGLLWAATLAISVARPTIGERYWLVEISLGYLVYYMALSFWLGGMRRHRHESGP